MPDLRVRSALARARRFWQRGSGSAAVLLYHRVVETRGEDPYELTVSASTFKQHLREAGRLGKIVPADELVARLSSGSSIRGLIAVTFDDGYVDNLSIAAGTAAELQVPVTVFIAVRSVLHGTHFWWDELARAVLGAESFDPPAPLTAGVSISLRSRAERMESLQRLHAVMRAAPAVQRAAILREICERLRPAADIDPGRPMTDDEIRRLAVLPGITIGAHTMTHPSLAALGRSEQLEELAGSREALERLLGRSVRLLAYPFGKAGNVSADTISAAREAGFAAAFTTIPYGVSTRTDPMSIPRLSVHEWDVDEFAGRLNQLLRG